MNYWDSVGRWINTLLVFIVGILSFDALFRLLEANEDNVIVSGVRVLSVAFLVPFRGMFGEQEFLLTTLIGVLGYALLAGIALGVLRSLQASRALPAPPVEPEAPVLPPDGAQQQVGQAPPRRRATRTTAKRTRQPADTATPTAESRERTAGPQQQSAEQAKPTPKPSEPETTAARQVRARARSDGQARDTRRPRRQPAAPATADAPERARRRARLRDRAVAKPSAPRTPDVDRGA